MNEGLGTLILVLFFFIHVCFGVIFFGISAVKTFIFSNLLSRTSLVVSYFFMYFINSKFSSTKRKKGRFDLFSSNSFSLKSIEIAQNTKKNDQNTVFTRPSCNCNLSAWSKFSNLFSECEFLSLESFF